MLPSYLIIGSFLGEKSEYILRNQDGRMIVNDIHYYRDGQNILIAATFLTQMINSMVSISGLI